MPALLQSILFTRRRRITDGRRRHGRRLAGRQPGIEGLESRAMLAGDDAVIHVGLVRNQVLLTLDPIGAAITNLATTYDAPAARLTITAATAGSLSMPAPASGISVDAVADTITVDLKKITRFAGLSIVGGANTDSVRIGPGGVNLASIGRGAAAQGFLVDTGAGASDSVTIACQIVAKGAGAVRLATKLTGVAHGILMASNVVTASGSQSFGGDVTFYPAAANLPAAAGKLKDGRYTFRTVAGEHRVVIRAVSDKPIITSPVDPPVYESIVPARYNDATTLTADVTPAGPNGFDFEFTSNKSAAKERGR